MPSTAACSPGPRMSCGSRVVMDQHRASQWEKGDHWPLSLISGNIQTLDPGNVGWDREEGKVAFVSTSELCLTPYLLVVMFKQCAHGHKLNTFSVHTAHEYEKSVLRFSILSGCLYEFRVCFFATGDKYTCTKSTDFTPDCARGGRIRAVIFHNYTQLPLVHLSGSFHESKCRTVLRICTLAHHLHTGNFSNTSKQ